MVFGNDGGEEENCEDEVWKRWMRKEDRRRVEKKDMVIVIVMAMAMAMVMACFSDKGEMKRERCFSFVWC